MTYHVGDAVPLAYTINNTATVVLTVTDPTGQTTTPATAPTGVAPAVTYSASVLVDKPGLWRYRFLATGTVTDAEPGSFMVEADSAADLYVTVGELRRELGARPGQLDDGLLAKACRSASRAVDNHCHRRFWLDPAPVARTFRPESWVEVEVPDIGSLTGLVVKTDDNADGVYETTWTIGTDYLTEPLNAAADGGAWHVWKLIAAGGRRFPVRDLMAVPYLSPYWQGTGATLRPSLEVTARWGWSTLPEPVREAATLLAMRLYKRKDTPLGFEGFQDFGAVRITRTDPDIAESLADYTLAVFA